MPTTVQNLFAAAGVPLLGSVPWGVPVPTRESGVYVVSLSEDPSGFGGATDSPVIDDGAICEWLNRVPSLEVDGQKSPGSQAVVDRLRSFWLPDENVVYIGKATAIGTRVGQYYNTPLGMRAPHSGGHWLKTLANLQYVYVHFGAAANPSASEDAMLEAFVLGVAEETRVALRDPSLPLPFANLKYLRGRLKRHGMRNQRIRRATRPQS